MRVLGLDLSSKTGYSILNDGKLEEYGLIKVEIVNFNVNDFPNLVPEYPINLINAANEMADKIEGLVLLKKPDSIVIENTVKGRNRNTQRWLEWLHFAVVSKFIKNNWTINYLDPSQWRSILSMRLSKDDKKNNSEVNKGKRRGKITRKHLSVRWVNDKFGLKLKLKDNDIADSIALNFAFGLKTGEYN